MFEQVALSQQVTAVITGRVVDPSGAVMAGAKVTAKSVERGVEYNTETNAEGLFKLPLLPIGTYDVPCGDAGISRLPIVPASCWR